MKGRKLSRRAALDLLFRSADDDSLFSDRLYLYLERHWRWVQDECLTALNSLTEATRKGAFCGLEHLAMQRKLQPETVVPILKQMEAIEPAASQVLYKIYCCFPAFRPSDWREPTLFVSTDRGREELEHMLESTDERTVCVALWDAANYEDDWHWVQTECLKRLKSSSSELRYGALVGLNYLALRGELDPDVVLSALQEVEEREWTGYIRENIYQFWKPQ